VAPAMISAPGILTGVDNALGGFNASVGTVAYEWQAIRPLGKMTATAGQNDSYGASLYEGLASDVCVAGRRLAADANCRAPLRWFGTIRRSLLSALLRASATRRRRHPDRSILRIPGEVLRWPNLYTPFGSDESENLETVLLALNHRVVWSPGDWLEVAASWRRNKDDYAFDRFAPLGPCIHFNTQRGAGGAAVSGTTAVASSSELRRGGAR